MRVSTIRPVAGFYFFLALPAGFGAGLLFDEGVFFALAFLTGLAFTALAFLAGLAFAADFGADDLAILRTRDSRSSRISSSW